MVAELPDSGVEPVATQNLGQDLPFVAIPLAPLVTVSVVDSDTEWQVVEMGPMDETPVGKTCEVPIGHAGVAGVPLQGDFKDIAPVRCCLQVSNIRGPHGIQVGPDAGVTVMQLAVRDGSSKALRSCYIHWQLMCFLWCYMALKAWLHSEANFPPPLPNSHCSLSRAK